MRDKIEAKIIAYAKRQVLGDRRDEPADDLEREELSDRIDRYRERCGIFQFIKPKDSILYYEKQDTLIQASSRVPVTCAVGANQIGKTSAICAIGISWALGEYLWTGEPVKNLAGKPVKPPIRGFHGGKSFTMAHTEVTMKKYNDLLPFEALGIEVDKQQGRSAHRIRFPADLGGSEIKLLSYEQDPEDFEGTTWHVILWDEPPPRHAYIGTKRGGMKHHAPQIFAFTPLKEPWLFDEIYSSPRTVHVAKPSDLRKLRKNSFAVVDFQLDDSPYLSREAKDEFIASLDPEEIEARVFGKWTHLLGRVYKDFDQAKHVLVTSEWFEQNKNWQNYTGFMAIDPHDRRPFACGWGVVTPRGDVVFTDEWPNQPFHKIKSWDSNVPDYVELFKQKEKDFPRVWFRLMDPNFGQTPKAGTGRTLVEEFDNHGVNFETRIDDDLTSGHAVVREALRNHSLFFLDRCSNLIKSMENYTWDEFRGSLASGRMAKEKPRDLFKDFCDVVRYAIKFPVAHMEEMQSLAPSWSNNGIG